MNILHPGMSLHPATNPNRGRLSGTAQSFTFGAQTGRGSDQSCVIKRTTDYKYHILITLVHQLAENAVGPALPYLGFRILKLGAGRNLNQRRDYHNHPDYPNHTMKFGKYRGGSLQMLRNGKWYSYDKENQWLSFDALKVAHRVTVSKVKLPISRTCFASWFRKIAVSPADHCSGLVMSMRISPVRTSLRTVLKCVVLALRSWRYKGGLVEELEVPGTCPIDAVGLSLSDLVTFGRSNWSWGSLTWTV